MRTRVLWLLRLAAEQDLLQKSGYLVNVVNKVFRGESFRVLTWHLLYPRSAV